MHTAQTSSINNGRICVAISPRIGSISSWHDSTITNSDTTAEYRCVQSGEAIRALANALTLDFSISDWAKQMAQYYGSDGTRGKALFIAHVETYKPWTFDPAQLFVGGYHVTEDDVLSPSMTNPFGELGSDQTGYFAFVVPAKELKKGKEIPIGYGDDSALWTVPK